MSKSYYDLLGVKTDSSPKEIKTAYRRLARMYHPDINSGREDECKAVNEAYGVLADYEKRERYDKYGENWDKPRFHIRKEPSKVVIYGGWSPGIR